MYVPSSFAETDLATLHDFVEQNSFGVLVSQVEGNPFATHLPFLLDRKTGRYGTLIGHVARANPQWQHFTQETVLAVFSGPHAYVSPTWYEAENVVPTWNYVAVHVSGSITVIEDECSLLEIVQKLTSVYERTMPQPWTFDPSATFIQRMLAQIVGFRIDITSIEGKFKLNQNHPVERREKVMSALRVRGGENALAIAAAMQLTCGMAEADETAYIHGTHPSEQDRLAKLGDLTDEAFLQFVEYSPNSSVLDVGSGLGNLASKLARRIPHGDVWGVEQSTEQLSKARADLPNLHFQQADAQKLPFEDERFDVTYCRYVLEHVSDPLRVLQEMRRVLKPGGKIFVQENNILVNVLYPECPHFDDVWMRFVELQKLLGGDALIGKKLLPLLTEAGFRNIRLSIQPEVHSTGTPTFVPWIENLIGNIQSGEKELLKRGLATEDQISNGLEDLRRLMNAKAGSAFFYWNRASGAK